MDTVIRGDGGGVSGCERHRVDIPEAEIETGRSDVDCSSLQQTKLAGPPTHGSIAELASYIGGATGGDGGFVEWIEVFALILPHLLAFWSTGHLVAASVGVFRIFGAISTFSKLFTSCSTGATDEGIDV